MESNVGGAVSQLQSCKLNKQSRKVELEDSYARGLHRRSWARSVVLSYTSYEPYQFKTRAESSVEPCLAELRINFLGLVNASSIKMVCVEFDSVRDEPILDD